MAITYTAIANTTISGSSTSTVNFNSIPQTYTDLRLVICCSVDTSTRKLWIRFNNAQGSYDYEVYGVNGSNTTGAIAVRSNGNSEIAIPQVNSNLSTSSTSPTFIVFDLMSYTPTNATKSFLYTANRGSAGTNFQAVNRAVGQWTTSNTAVTSINILLSGSGVFLANSTFGLYGILRA